MLTAAMLAGLVQALGGTDLGELWRALPGTPLFYLWFALLYLAQPVLETAVFHRIWGLPRGSGFAALARKRIIDEVVFGYTGEAWFYTWATHHGGRAGRAFAGIKDVAILSALAGNLLTLVLAAAAIPVAWHAFDAASVRLLGGAAAVTLAASLPFLVFRARVFSLDPATLRWVFGVQLLRFVLVALFTAFAWGAALPAVGAATWLVLSAGRLVVSRLPVPGKELLFATLTLALIGTGRALTDVIAVTAALTLGVHLIVLAAIGVGAVSRWWRSRDSRARSRRPA